MDFMGVGLHATPRFGGNRGINATRAGIDSRPSSISVG
jgi:hypothetical protein